MVAVKPGKFVGCITDFVRYLNVVERYDRLDAVLNMRVGFCSYPDGKIGFWCQDFVYGSTEADEARFYRVVERVAGLVVDLNRLGTFSDEKIAHTFDIFDQGTKICLEVVGHGR